MYRIFLILLALVLALPMAGCVAPPEKPQTEMLAQAATKTWHLSLPESDEAFSENCKLNLMAEGKPGRFTVSMKGKYYDCGFNGPVKITADEAPGGTLVFVEGERGGDANHTGPIVAVYRLTDKGFKTLGQQELFGAQYHRRHGHIVSVTGKVMFSFCFACDGPEVDDTQDNVFVPAVLRPGCGGICVKPVVTAKQRKAIIADFARIKAEAAKVYKEGDAPDFDWNAVTDLERRFHAFIRKGR